MANGKFAGGDGTPGNPYLVEDVFDFNKIRLAPAAAYLLVNNIDFGEPPFNKGFMPIQNFTGRLDGAGRKLMNLYINKPTVDNVGLFATSSFSLWTYAAGATPNVENVVVVNAHVTGGTNVGVLFGSLYVNAGAGAVTVNMFGLGMFTNVYVSGVVNGNTNVGSLVGSFTFAINNTTQVLVNGVHVNTDLTARSTTGVVSGLIGCTGSAGFNYFTYANTFIDAVAHGPSTDPVSFCSGGQASTKVVTQAVYFNDDAWTGVPQGTSALGRTVVQMTTIDGFDDLLLAVTETGASAFRFRYGARPELAIRKSGVTLVRAGGALYDYDVPSGKFVQVFADSKQPYWSILRQGGVDVSTLSTTALATLRTQLGDVLELLEFVDSSAGSTVDKTTVAMDRDAGHDYGDRVCFKTTLKLNDNVVGVWPGAGGAD